MDASPDRAAAQDIKLAELLGALSHALDITEGHPAGHCIRCCWIGLHVGREAGLPETALADLYYTLLLKDLGCSSNAARICQLYLTDDLSFKRDFKLINGSLPQALRFVLSHTGLKAGLAERFRAIVNIVQNGGQIARELIETRCQRGAEIARRMRFSEAVAEGIQNLDEHWDGGGKPTGAVGTAIPIFSRIALLAQVVDVFFMAGGRQAAIREVVGRAGTWFDPDLVAAFQRVAERPDFWAILPADTLQQHILDLSPGQMSQTVDDDYLDDIASAFALVIDSKSPFTAGHSERVTLFTDLIAEQMGHDAEARRWLKRAALLHDIGKLGVSNTILDKPGKLDTDERAEIEQHSAHSEAILAKIDVFRRLAPIAGGHHERLDGKGYPRGLTAEAIPTETRIITTADIFDALTADRPYRAAMPVSQALGIMEGMVDSAVDRDCLDALRRALGAIETQQAA